MKLLPTKSAVLVGLALLMCSCSGPIQLSVSGTDDVNDGNAVTVVYFQLSSSSTFESAPPAEFWRDGNAVLSGSVVGQEHRFVLGPGEERSIEIEPRDEASYIGFAADYRSPQGNDWKHIFSVEELKGKSIALTVARNRLIVEVQ